MLSELVLSASMASAVLLLLGVGAYLAARRLRPSRRTGTLISLSVNRPGRGAIRFTDTPANDPLLLVALRTVDQEIKIARSLQLPFELEPIIDPNVGQVVPVPPPLEPIEAGIESFDFLKPSDIQHPVCLDSLGYSRIAFPSEKFERQYESLTRIVQSELPNLILGASSVIEDLCSVLTPSLKFLLDRAPDEIVLHTEIASVYRESLISEFKEYQRVYFRSRKRGEVIAVVSKFNRIGVQIYDERVTSTLDLSHIKKLDDDELCLMLGWASVLAIKATFKLRKR